MYKIWTELSGLTNNSHCGIALILHSSYWPERGDSTGFQKEVRSHISLCENDPSSNLSFKSSSAQHEVLFVNDCHIHSKIDNQGYA